MIVLIFILFVNKYFILELLKIMESGEIKDISSGKKKVDGKQLYYEEK
jgi:hypothetical protein